MPKEAEPDFRAPLCPLGGTWRPSQHTGDHGEETAPDTQTQGAHGSPDQVWA